MRLRKSAPGDAKSLADSMALMPATPLEYLDRLALHNELFGRSVEFLGLVQSRGGYSLVTSQIFLRGSKPTVDDIARLMAAYDFQKLRGENAYFRPNDRLAVFDAHARNYVLTDGVPVPFDVIPQHVSGRMEALLSLWN